MNIKTKTFEELIVWQKAHEFVLKVYEYTSQFPKHELFGLSSQFRRAAVSIPANIAEGYRKTGLKDKIRFYNIAEGSINECSYYLRLATDLNYGDNKSMVALLTEISKLIHAYSKNVI